MVVVFVNKYDLEVGFLEFIGQLQPAKSAAYDDDALFVCFGNVETQVW